MFAKSSKSHRRRGEVSMNLIEKPGGYAQAKALIALPASTYDCGVKFSREELESAMLEYRRENNIFEVGDYVVYKSNAGLGGLFQIETLTKTGKPKTVKTKRFGNFPCRYCEVQHATLSEIKAGHRL